jgi:hypothetical protein
LVKHAGLQWLGAAGQTAGSDNLASMLGADTPATVGSVQGRGGNNEKYEVAVLISSNTKKFRAFVIHSFFFIIYKSNKNTHPHHTNTPPA